MYLLLLGYQWVSGPLPASEKTLARAIRYDDRAFRRLWPTVRGKFVAVDGGLANPRLEEHRAKSASISKKNSASGSKGAAARWRNDGERHESANGGPMASAMADAIDVPCERHESANGVTHSNPSHPIEDKNPPTPRKRGERAKSETTIPEDFTLDDDLTAYVRRTIPDADPTAMFEDFRTKATAKGWKHANWRAAFQTYVRNCRQGSGHWAAGQYPRIGGAIQWQ